MKLQTLVIVDVGLVSVLLAAGQVLLKLTVSGRASAGLIDLLFVAFWDWRAWAAVVCTGTGAVLWLRVISKVELSMAYPMISMSYIFGVIGAMVFCGEQVPSIRWVGVVVICLGVSLLNLS